MSWVGYRILLEGLNCLNDAWLISVDLGPALNQLPVLEHLSKISNNHF